MNHKYRTGKKGGSLNTFSESVTENQCCAVSDQSYKFQLWLQLKFGTVMNCYPSANCPTPVACNTHDLVASISQWQLAPQQD